MTVGVAISTHKRPFILGQALSFWAKWMPDVLVVNHDAAGAGVAATKNLGIAALMDAGCSDLFLADDDVWPITERWADPYITSEQPHLMHCWGKSRFIKEDPQNGVTQWTWPRGPMLYVQRHVVERVGGMRTEFGRWGGEHAEWSRRIRNAGFTEYAFQDAAAARRGIWHCADYLRDVPSSVPPEVRDGAAVVARRHALYDTYRYSADYVEFRASAGLPSARGAVGS